jgi:A/G-specific adenine glycosylase
MLQQTQVATVIPYYQRFLEAFPTLTRLASAPRERLLELWSGLGYYRRARYLHEAAQQLKTKFAGRFPDDYTSLRGLPGIGDYTAKAVLSIAFRQPYAVLDGNVARVVARLFALRGNLHQPEFRRAVERALARLLSRRQPGDFNQALMELGQTICLPRAPRCPVCPLRKRCCGFNMGDPATFPLPRPRRATESHYLAVALLRRGTRVALVRGLDEGLLADLWNFPAAFGRSPTEARERLRQKLHLLAHSFSLGEPLAEFRHTITFRSIRGNVYPVEGCRGVLRGTMRWFDLTRLPQAAISQLARKIVQKIPEACGEAPRRVRSPRPAP